MRSDPARTADPTYRTGRAMGSHQSTRALSTTWLTPPHVIEALGGPDSFDLDPCASPGWPTARRAITLPDDGMSAAWDGRVWLNPPYGFEAWRWLDRLADHGTGTALVFARTETDGFVRTVWGRATAVLFIHGRLYFHRPDGTRATANAGAPSALVAYGVRDAERLARSGLGTYLRVERDALAADADKWQRAALTLQGDRDALTDERDSLSWQVEALRAERDARSAERDALAAKVERVRALHRPAYNDAARSPMCEDCEGKAGIHPCGCWAEDDYEFVCAVCNQGTKNQSVPWPCPTIRALDEKPQP